MAITWSCKKENKKFPTVQILEPQDNENFEFGDTITVKAQISDRNGAVLVSMQKGSVLLPTNHKKTFDDQGIVEFEIYLTDKYLETDEYVVRVSAENIENVSSDYVNIDYIELEKEFLGYVTLENAGSTKDIGIRKTNGANHSLTVTGDHPFLSVNSLSGVVQVAPSFEGDMEASDLDGQFLFKVPNPTSPGTLAYRFLNAQSNLIFSFENEGFIYGWNSSGGLGRNFKLINNRVPLTAGFGDPGLLVGAQERGKQSFELMLISPINGALLKNKFIPDEVRAIEFIGNENFVVIADRAGSSVIYLYQSQSNVLTEFASVNEPYRSFEHITANVSIIGTSQGIYYFNPINSTLPVKINNTVSSDIEYDPVNSVIYLASGNQVLAGTINAGWSPIYTGTSPILQLELIFNK